jgi:hypothetical protein
VNTGKSEQTNKWFYGLPSAVCCLLSAWLGAAVFFSAAVAPAAFGVLRGAQVVAADELAGAIVSRVLAVINVSGFVVSLLALAGLWAARRRFLSVETALIAVAALTTGAGRGIIGTRMQTLRAQAGRPLAELAKSDPLRVAFDQLHGYSVIILTIGMIAVLLALILLARVRR